MAYSLWWAALMLGLMGSPHCLGMCGVACHALGGRTWQGQMALHLARGISYALMGAVVAVFIQGTAWLANSLHLLRPIWAMFHAALALLGLSLLYLGRQPAWLDGLMLRFGIWWRGGEPSSPSPTWQRAWRWGLLWGLLPCGLLYSALMLATLTANVVQAMGLMVTFSLGTHLALGFGSWFGHRFLRILKPIWATRLAGCAMLIASIAALILGFTHRSDLWCITP